ncbi:MAG: helix-turn-helix domain-containing protein [Halobacteriales archaeon]|nr:helix-turn-helix domain-containing protein [Halobacteriales archaeon]
MVDESPSGIRAEIRIGSPSDCPVAEISGKNDVRSRSVSKTTPTGSSLVTEEVLLDSGCDAEPGFENAEFGDEDGMKKSFSYGSKGFYRFSREQGRGCACERVEGFGFPVVDTYTHDGDLFLVFHVPDTETLKQVIGKLRERYIDVGVRRLIRSKESEDRSLVLVDRSELTGKQEEALRKAHEMGYFEHPKGANAGEVADALGVATSTFTEHLSAAQSKLLRSIVEG